MPRNRVYNSKSTAAGTRKFWILAVLIILAGLLFYAYKNLPQSLKERFFVNEHRYDAFIAKAAGRYDLDPRLVRAVIWRESAFRSAVRGSRGEIGPMQIMRKWAVTDWAQKMQLPIPCDGILFDPELNIEIGCWYLAQAMRRWRDHRHCVELALCTYNAGYSRAARWSAEYQKTKKSGDFIKIIDIKSTADYVNVIIKRYNEYCKL